MGSLANEVSQAICDGLTTLTDGGDCEVEYFETHMGYEVVRGHERVSIEVR